MHRTDSPGGQKMWLQMKKKTKTSTQWIGCCCGDYLMADAPVWCAGQWQEKKILLENHTNRHTSGSELQMCLASFTCWFTSVDPVWVCNAGYCKDICCQEQAPWNDREFIHIAGRWSGVWRGEGINVVVVVQVWPPECWETQGGLLSV